MDDTNTNLNTTDSTVNTDAERQSPAGDLDDLIFRGEGWLISDR